MGSREKHSSKRSRDDERSKGDRVSKRRSRSASKQSNPSSQRHKRTSDIEFEMTRIAARAIRDIARYNDGLKGEIRQLAEALDAGNALDISDIKDDYLHDKVKILFDNLPQLRKKSSGSYVCRSRSSSSVMSFIAPMLEQDVSFPEPELQAFPSSNNEELNPSPPRENNPPRTSNAEKPPEPSDPVGIRPVMGPAAPPSHVLEEAAALKEQMEMEKNTIEPEGDSELIGPPPPQLEVEVEAATTDQRVGEILRIMRILHAHENAKDQTKGRATEGATGHSAPDAYDILGVDPQASGGEIKKRYWRLSLLIHPDKCSHPQAPIAFAAVAVAAQQLQDASGRASVDKTREENELMQFTANFLAKEERERQWRTARGEQEQPRIPSQPARTTRESWMTEVPPAFLGKSNDSGRIFTDVKADNHPSPTLHAGARSGASLMEKHQASLAREKKAGGNRHQADDWDKDLHPWRPFDRTKDLEARTPSASKPGAATDFVSATTKLSSRFAPGR